MLKLNRFISLLVMIGMLLWVHPTISFAQGQCGAGPSITETVTKDPDWPECFELDPCNCDFPLFITSPGPDGAQINDSPPPGGSGSIVITVSGGVSPYFWSVSPSNVGWALDYDETDEESNTLRLDFGYSCQANNPTATVTVTDSCGVSDEILVRNGQGYWDMIGSRSSGQPVFYEDISNCYQCSSGSDVQFVYYNTEEYRWVGSYYRCAGNDYHDCYNPCQGSGAWGGGWGICPTPPCGNPVSCGGTCTHEGQVLTKIPTFLWYYHFQCP